MPTMWMTMWASCILSSFMIGHGEHILLFPQTKDILPVKLVIMGEYGINRINSYQKIHQDLEPSDISNVLCYMIIKKI